MYDAEVAYADSLIARVLDWLRQKGLEENTLLIITGDHGEELYDHSGISTTWRQSMAAASTCR